MRPPDSRCSCPSGTAPFARFVLADITDDYTITGNWDLIDNWHGLHGDIQADPIERGSFSAQPAAICFGPEPGMILCGTDTTHDWLFMAELPLTDSALTGQVQFKHVYGFPQCAGIAGSNTDPKMIPILSTIKDVRPEFAGNEGSPAVAFFVPAPDPNNSTSAPIIAMSYRLLYYPIVSDTPDSWTQVAAIRAGAGSSVVYGDYIYWNHSEAGLGFKKVPVPEILSLEPVLIGPGGANRAIQDCAFAPFSGVNTSLQNATLCNEVSPGVFEDPTTGLDLPPVPCKAAAVYRIRSSRTSTTPSDRPASVGNILASSDGTQLVTWPAGNSGIQRARLWVLDGTRSNLSPNKTTQLGISTDPANTTPGLAVYGGARYSCGDIWCPVPLIGRRDTSPNPFLFPVDIIGSDSGTDPDDNYCFVAVDQIQAGKGSLSYPLSPATGATPSSFDDEVLTVSGLGLSCAGHWRVRIAGMHPTGNWDHYANRGSLNAQNDFIPDRV